MADFDIHDPAFAAFPFAAYRELREREPVHASERYGGHRHVNEFGVSKRLNAYHVEFP